MKYIGIAMLALFLAVGASAQSKENTTAKAEMKGPAKEMTYSGYVVDQMCAGGMEKKADAMTKAAAHTRDCALSEHCAASGYGLFINGKYHPFDSKGSELTKSMLEKSKTDNHIYAMVTGSMKGNTLEVSSIKEEAAPKAEAAPKK